MNLEQVVVEELWSGEKCIGFFVHEGLYYWVLDHKYNFSLDAEKDYVGYLNKGHITQAQYEVACKEFRGGVLKLTSKNFLKYLGGGSAKVLSVESLAGIFDVGVGRDTECLLKAVEVYYLSGVELCSSDYEGVGRLASRLPLFYVNFDRKIYMHMDFGRCHEDLSYPDWLSKYSDFSFLIPDEARYWLKNGDYWKFRFVQIPC